MMLRTPEQYVESLRDGRVVYQDGERVEDVPSHPVFRESVERAASEYLVALQPEYRKLFNVVEDGEEYSFTYRPPRTPEDIERRRQICMTAHHLGIETRATGIDGLNGVAIACHKVDAALGTNYGERIDNYRKWCQQHDPGICGAVSDPKGNRELHADDPRQKHKDFYLKIVDRTSDGIYINGCKLHISHSIWQNELMCLPSRNHGESAKDYAVACAVPANAKGVIFIGTGSQKWYGEAGRHPMIIFDNVFVPNERVFLAGEWQFSREAATSFGRYHRFFGDVHKCGLINSVVGLANLI
jgi:4-hydroxybutyryl-CoA dehydratase/vinylacetyl-CoA-Delta-isomerase